MEAIGRQILAQCQERNSNREEKERRFKCERKDESSIIRCIQVWAEKEWALGQQYGGLEQFSKPELL